VAANAEVDSFPKKFRRLTEFISGGILWLCNLRGDKILGANDLAISKEMRLL
jgi:hypothetical protein